ncbi:MAG TPA: hypothetical protein VKA74_05060, partial [Myxococcota bacterium]|nr:hypothetical protein [Myxococcota bacterium]
MAFPGDPAVGFGMAHTPRLQEHYANPEASSGLCRSVTGVSMDKILITGVGSGLGRLVARELRSRMEVIGVDRAPAKRFPPGVSVQRLDLRKRPFEELMRKER